MIEENYIKVGRLIEILKTVDPELNVSFEYDSRSAGRYVTAVDLVEHKDGSYKDIVLRGESDKDYDYLNYTQNLRTRVTCTRLDREWPKGKWWCNEHRQPPEKCKQEGKSCREDYSNLSNYYKD